MKKLLFLAGLALLAGCTSVHVNPGNTVDCIKAAAIKCAADNIVVTADGDTVDLAAYGVWEWAADGSLKLKK